jgi:spore coat protein U-like protein
MLASAQSCEAACNFGNAPSVTAPTLDFGTYLPSSSSTSNVTVSITCPSGGTVPPLTFTMGKGGSGTYSSRQLSNGAHLLNYNIYRQAAFTSVYGDGSGGSVNASYPGGSATTVTTIGYGMIPANQYAAAGIYSDSIVLTIIY